MCNVMDNVFENKMFYYYTKNSSTDLRTPEKDKLYISTELLNV
jgi:hypothetical protein